jgi:hypothetical protein
MKNLLRTLFTVALNCTIFSSYAGPFGLEQGMTLDQIKKITQVKEINKFKYSAYSLPMGSKDVEIYIFFLAPTIGLCNVDAYSKEMKTSSTGAELKAEFNSYVKILSEKYGSVTSKYDFLHANSVWKESNYWMRSLEQKERDLMYVWFTSTTKPLPDSLYAIGLRAEAASATSGFLSVEYEYKNFQKCVEAQENDNKKTKKETMKNF